MKNKIDLQGFDVMVDLSVVLHTCATALTSTPSLKSLLMALQMGLEHKKEFPWEWRRSTAGNGVASCAREKKGNRNKAKVGQSRLTLVNPFRSAQKHANTKTHAYPRTRKHAIT